MVGLHVIEYLLRVPCMGMGIPMGIPVGMGWVWGLKCHPRCSPARLYVTVLSSRQKLKAHPVMISPMTDLVEVRRRREVTCLCHSSPCIYPCPSCAYLWPVHALCQTTPAYAHISHQVNSESVCKKNDIKIAHIKPAQKVGKTFWTCFTFACTPINWIYLCCCYYYYFWLLFSKPNFPKSLYVRPVSNINFWGLIQHHFL